MTEIMEIQSFIISYLRKKRFFYTKLTPIVFNLNGINYLDNRDTIEMSIDLLLNVGTIERKSNNSQKYRLKDREIYLQFIYPERENLIYYSILLRLIVTTLRLINWVKKRKFTFPSKKNLTNYIRSFNRIFDFLKRLIAIIVFIVILKTIIINKCGLDIHCIIAKIWNLFDWSSNNAL